MIASEGIGLITMTLRTGSRRMRSYKICGRKWKPMTRCKTWTSRWAIKWQTWWAHCLQVSGFLFLVILTYNSD